MSLLIAIGVTAYGVFLAVSMILMLVVGWRDTAPRVTDGEAEARRLFSALDDLQCRDARRW